MRLTAISLLAAAVALSQGTETKPALEQYPVHTTVGETGVGAEYMVQSVGSSRGSFTTDSYLVVDVALFPPKTGMIVATSAFRLRLNGKETHMAQSVGSVAASVKYPDWDRQRGLVIGAGPITIGRPAQVERFPGDNRPTQSRVPGQTPRAPTSAADTGAEPVEPGDILNATALPEGPRKTPVSGYVFFPYRGRLTKLKKVELLVSFRESDEPTVLRLR